MPTKPNDPKVHAEESQTGDGRAPAVSQKPEPAPVGGGSPMEDLARQHGEAGVVAHRGAHMLPLLDDMREMKRFIRAATVYLREKSAQEPLSYGSEWML